MLTDCGDPSGMGDVVRIQDDPPAIPEILKDVRRSVLIHSHDRLTASLHGGKRTVRLAGRCTATPARHEYDHGDESGGLNDATPDKHPTILRYLSGCREDVERGEGPAVKSRALIAVTRASIVARFIASLTRSPALP
jgi:hypothetical protein